MLKKILPALLLGISAHAGAQTFPVSNIKINGADSNRVNLVFLAEGYTSAELSKFVTDATGVNNIVFTESPLKEYRNFYNTYAIQVPSPQSGTDHPGTATDVAEPAFPVASVNTYFNSTFDNAGTHRAIVALNGAGVYNVAAQNVPDYDLLYVLVNSTEYGGTGGGYCVSTMHTSAPEITLHEIGHTFAGLADEYWAGTVFANEKPNMTAQSNPALVKWVNWINVNGIGVYPYGTSGVEATWYRPHQNCKMQFLGPDFCQVCKESIVDKMYTLVTPIDDRTPRSVATVPYTGAPLNFNVKLVRPIPNTLELKWVLNTTTLSSTDTFVNINGTQLVNGVNELTAYVTDTTNLSRLYRPADGYQFSSKWTIVKDPTGITKIENTTGNKFFYHFYPMPAHDMLMLSYTNETNARNLSYAITDISGRVVKKGYVAVQQGKQETTLDVSSLVPGTYSVRFEGDQVSFGTQIVKE